MLLHTTFSTVAASAVGLGDFRRQLRTNCRLDAFESMMELAAVRGQLLMMIPVIIMPEKAYSEADMQNGVTTTDITTQRRTTAPTD